MRTLLVLALLAPLPAAAFERITDRAAFLALTQGRELRTLGIRMTVGADGTLGGRAFGGAVTGTWDWEDGFFCRTLAYGSRTWARDCQTVAIEGTTLRFTADRGAGDRADLRLR